MTIQTPEEYATLRAKLDRHYAWLGNRTSYRADEVPADCQVSNEEASAVEVYEFTHNPPDRYFLYIDEGKKTAQTWTGDLLGNVQFGRAYKSPAFGGFPSTRVPVTILAVNGRKYYGTYYKSSGDYARVKAAKQ